MSKRTAMYRRPRGKVAIWLNQLLPKFKDKVWKYSDLKTEHLDNKSAFMLAIDCGYIASEGVDSSNTQYWKIVYSPKS